MDNQHKMIKGYRDLSAEEIALMNEIKEQAEVMRELTNKVYAHLNRTCTHVQEERCIEDRGYSTMSTVGGGYQIRQGSWVIGPDANTQRWQAAQPYDWLTRAKNDLQDGLMKLTRAVAQPTSF